MKRLRIFTERLRALLRRDAVIDEIDEEMRSHFEMETQTNTRYICYPNTTDLA